LAVNIKNTAITARNDLLAARDSNLVGGVIVQGLVLSYRLEIRFDIQQGGILFDFIYHLHRTPSMCRESGDPKSASIVCVTRF
jgi:hypothetical protein